MWKYAYIEQVYLTFLSNIYIGNTNPSKSLFLNLYKYIQTENFQKDKGQQDSC